MLCIFLELQAKIIDGIILIPEKDELWIAYGESVMRERKNC